MLKVHEEMQITANALKTCTNPIEQQIIVQKLQMLAGRVQKIEKALDEIAAEAMEDAELMRIESDAGAKIVRHPAVPQLRVVNGIDADVARCERGWTGGAA